MPFYIFAWIASVSFGLVAIIGKLTGKYAIRNPYLFTFFWTLFSLMITIPIALSNHVGFPLHWNNIIIAAVLSSLFNILYIVGLSKLDVSVFSALFNFRPAITAILSVLILGEILTGKQYLFIGIIFIAGIFSSMDEKFSLKSFWKISIATTIAAILCYALSNIFINKSMAENGYWEVSLWTAIISQIILLVTYPKFAKEVRKITPKQIGAVFAMSLSLLIGTLTANKAYAENVTISATITALPFSMIMAFLFSIFAPQLLEKHTLKVYAIRFSAAAVMIAAALKISM